MLGGVNSESGARRVLIAEDEGLVALELETILESWGYVVIGPSSSVEHALRLAEESGCNNALVDVNLRGRQIFDILPQLKALGVRVVITSGYEDETFFPPAFRGLPRIVKPFDERKLRRVCESVFGQPLDDGAAAAY